MRLPVKFLGKNPNPRKGWDGSRDVGWWRLILGRLVVTYTRRSGDTFLGRFGGGWNWEVGVQVGSTTVIVNLLVAYVRFYWAPRCEVCGKTMGTGLEEDRRTEGGVCFSCRKAHEEGP